MLWNIDNTPHTILGSIHLFPPGQELPEWVSSAVSGIGRIAFKADRTRTAEFLEIGVDRDAPHLDVPGARALYDRAASILQEAGNEVPFDALRPWRANIHMTLALLAASESVAGDSGVEALLRARAEQDGLQLAFLESPSRAFDLFELASCGPTRSSEGFAAMQRLVADPSLAKRNYFRILTAWLGSSLSDLADFFK